MKKNVIREYFFAINIFLGAFLLFLIQPVIGKIITPIYGGVSQVWSLCLFFFQATLFLGYTLTFVLNKFTPRIQSIIYMVFIAFAVIILKIPSAENLPTDSYNPAMSLFMALLQYIAVPIIFVSSISTLMQNWFGIVNKQDPYYLYSVSNIGSVMALLLFPIAIESHISTSMTVLIWKSLFWLLAMTAGIVAVMFFVKTKDMPSQTEQKPEEAQPVSIMSFIKWAALSFAGTILLLSYTTHITNDIAPVALLWIIPLGLYLLTFIVIFGSNEPYNRHAYISIAIVLVLLLYYSDIATIQKLLFSSLLMFSLCMLCHGELYNSRPHYTKLPLFYLTIAFGGALGGMFINFVAPVIFNSYLEFQIINAIMLCFMLYLIIRHKIQFMFNKKVDLAVRVMLFAIFVQVIYITFQKEIYTSQAVNLLEKKRNFYGTYFLALDKRNYQKELCHGNTRHGYQFVNPETKQLIYEPTAYFSRKSGVALVENLIRQKKPALNVGIIGLGAGVLAYYGQKGDNFDFFEIDPKVIDVANREFTFLSGSKANIKIILGDGRLNIVKEPDKKYDIVVLDAFNSDAIPVHLLTIEAVEQYLNKLNDSGVLIVHISNRFLNLENVLDSISSQLKLTSASIMTKSTPEDKAMLANKYYVIAKDKAFIDKLMQDKKPYRKITLRQVSDKNKLWTDDYSNLFTVLRFN